LIDSSEASEKDHVVNWRRVLAISGCLVAAAVALTALSFVRLPGSNSNVSSAHIVIPHKNYSSDELRAIQTTYWTRIEGDEKICAMAYVDGFMDALRKECESEGGAEDIGGGCGHMTSPMNYPAVLEAGMRHCGVQF